MDNLAAKQRPYHVLVTGAGSGIGASIVRALSQQGAAVSLVGRRLDALQGVVAALPDAASRLAAIAADVTNAEACRQAVHKAGAALGPVDVIVANAGVAESAPFARLDADHWQRMLDVNLTGAFHTVHAALADLTRPVSDAQSIRRIIFVSSTAGLKGYPYVAAYVAAKHGVIGLMRALASEYAMTPITVNAICPGYTQTPMLARSVDTIVGKTGRTADEARRALARSNPQGRLIDPDEVAATVLWLCSPLAQSITGQALSVSGGEV
jgi:NAD(P)-dependent dehydrogenase (short-subunit alcohol dehydrogenase family)